MTIPKLTVSPGALKLAYERELERYREKKILKRFWSKDTKMWPSIEARGNHRARQLDWLEIPDELEGYARRAARAAEGIGDEISDVVFIALGSSNLAAEILPPLGLFAHGKRLFILDTVHPYDIRQIEENIDPQRTLFLMVSKSGKLIETHGLFLYFLERLKALGSAHPGRNFIAVTEENSYLRGLAGEYHFRNVFVDPVGFPSRFSGVIHFTMLLSGLCKRDPREILERVKSVQEACKDRSAHAGHPAMSPAALLSAGAESEYWRLGIVTHRATRALGNRLAQLIGTSACGEDKGIVPIMDFRPDALASLQGRFLAICLRDMKTEDTELTAAEEYLKKAEIPSVFVEIKGVEDFAVEIYRWEVATCLMTSAIEVNPFEAPEMESGRARAMATLNAKSPESKPQPAKARMVDDDFELYLEGVARQTISMLSLRHALRTLFQSANESGYLGMLSFLPSLGSGSVTLQKLSERIGATLRVPVLLCCGPRYLHIVGQCFKAGPPGGVFLMLTSEIEKDIAIPGAGYTFGELNLALALSDFDVLTLHKRVVLRLHLRRGVGSGIEQLQRTIEQTLIGIR